MNISLPFLVISCVLGASPLSAASVAVVRGDLTSRLSAAESRSVASYCQNVKDCLNQAGIPFDELGDQDVATGNLGSRRVAVLPYNPVLSDPELAELDRFLARGGKLVVFYAVHPRLAPKLGVRLLQHERSEPGGQFSAMQFRPGLIPGLPESVTQASWNINVVEVANPRARILAEWLDQSGKPTGRPAWVLSSNGVWMSHVLLPGDPLAKRRMMLALIGHYVPWVWEKAARSGYKAIGRIAGVRNIEGLASVIAAARIPEPVRQTAQRELGLARRDRQRAFDLMLQNRYVESLAAADSARGEAAAAYYRVQPSKQGEFRGAWIHSPYGINDWGWDRSARVLKENGFGAVFANMLWAGLSFYPSQLLPVADRVAEEGDQVAKCLQACHRSQIQLHVWKVNHNLANAPSNFVAQLRAAGRTQKSRTGEDIDWLCPSHPDNFALERDSMLEVVRRYEIDGIHFDYIRYPNANACYCAGCARRFQEASAIPVRNWPDDVLAGDLARVYGDWRRAQITRLVRAVSEEARRIRPGIKVSAAVFGDWDGSRHQVGQDWKAWVDAGWLDFVCPMNYDTNNRGFSALVQHQVAWVGHKIPLYPGIGVHRMTSPEQAIQQIQLTRDLGADGFVLFQLDAQLAREFLPALRMGATSLPPK